MSYNKSTRRRTTFGMERLETRKLTANVSPPADAGIDHLDADVDPGNDGWEISEAQLEADARIDYHGELVGSTGPNATLDAVGVDLVMQDTGAANDPGDFDF